MDGLTAAALTARAVVAAVLLASGAAKTVDLHSFARTLSAIGIPERWSRQVAVATAAGELGLGIMSIAGAWVTLVDSLVLALTIAFVLVTAVAIANGRNVACRCFGALSNSRFGARSLVRAGVLSAAAAFVLARNSALEATYDPLSAGTAMVLVVAALFAFASAQAARAVEIVQKERGA